MNKETSLAEISQTLDSLSEFKDMVKFFAPHYRQVVDLVEEMEAYLLLHEGETFSYAKGRVMRNSLEMLALKNKERIHELWTELGDMAHEVEALTAMVSRVAFLTMEEGDSH